MENKNPQNEIKRHQRILRLMGLGFLGMVGADVAIVVFEPLYSPILACTPPIVLLIGAMAIRSKAEIQRIKDGLIKRH